MFSEEIDYQQEFAQMLRLILLRLNWSQSNLARKLDVSRQFVGTFCNGKSLPNCKTLEHIMHIFTINNVKREIRMEFFRIYITALFQSSTSKEFLRTLLWPDTPAGHENDIFGKAVVSMLHSLAADSGIEEFYRSLLNSADADYCSVFKNVNGKCELISLHCCRKDKPKRNELETLGTKYFRNWMHMLDGETVLEIEIPEDVSFNCCSSGTLKLKSFAYLTGMPYISAHKEALALIYLHRKPLYHEHNRKIINCAAKFLKLHYK